MDIPQRNEIRQRVKNWADEREKRGFSNGELASFVCDLFGEYFPVQPAPMPSVPTITKDEAWDELRPYLESPTEPWTVGEVVTFRGFFNWGWEKATLANSQGTPK